MAEDLVLEELQGLHERYTRQLHYFEDLIKGREREIALDRSNMDHVQQRLNALEEAIIERGGEIERS